MTALPASVSRSTTPRIPISNLFDPELTHKKRKRHNRSSLTVVETLDERLWAGFERKEEENKREMEFKMAELNWRKKKYFMDKNVEEERYLMEKGAKKKATL